MASTITRDGYVFLRTEGITETELSVQRTDSDTDNPLAQIKMFGSGKDDFQGVLSFETINSGSSDGPTEERMRIHTNGNVGIGTAEPEAKLEVVDSSRVSSINNYIQFDKSWGGVPTIHVDSSDATGPDGRAQLRLHGKNPQHNQIGLRMDGPLTVDEGSTAWLTGNVWMATKDDTSVGIGTVDPESKLDVFTEGAKGAHISVSDHALTLKGVNDPVKYSPRLPYIQWRMADNTRAMYVGWGDTKAKYISMRLENGFDLSIDGGNVGIGTTPQEIYKLDVRGYNMLTDPELNYNSHFPYKNNCAYITGSKVYIRGGKPDGWKKCLTVDGASGWTRIGDGSSTNNIQFEPQSGFHRVAFNELRFWDWDTKEDMVIFKDGNVTINGKLKLPQGAEINEFSTDETLSGNSDSAVPTEKAVRSYVDKIQSGTCSVGKIDGDGDRIRKKTIFFKPNFSSTPKVVLGVTNLDVHRGYNLRYIVNYEDLTEKGFTIIFKTWSNTYIYGGRVQWMAYGRI